MSNVRVADFHKTVVLKNPDIFQENTIYAKVLFTKAAGPQLSTLL